MQINRLRLVGFKSFVDPTELLIEKGLTGVVGPNGCGKSNLLEALRWVMGETSHKSMRAAAMDDVIFSGTNTRPSRNSAEVTIFLDNSARQAPAQFNDADVVEITRRIEREAGSAYRINSREVRARDVKILFEDAATGARSPALVRQGQIGEIVNARPDQRRRILEDAAGVAGLHSRRHEAELRLKQAEGNLARLGDILGQLNSQVESLKRQARQARRYREISGDIRKAEAIQLYLAWQQANELVTAEESALRAALVILSQAEQAASAAARAEHAAAVVIPSLRETEATAAATFARLKVEQTNLEREAERMANRLRELEARRAQLDADAARESRHVEEARGELAAIADELLEMEQAAGETEDAHTDIAGRVAAAEAAATAAQDTLNAVTRRLAEVRGRRLSLEQSVAERRTAALRANEQLAQITRQIEEATFKAPDAAARAEHQAQCEALTDALVDLEAATPEAEERVREAQATLRDRADAVQKAALAAREVATERATLARVLVTSAGSNIIPIVDLLKVADGYEAALGAALGEDLDAPVDDTAPAHWRKIDPASEDGRLPEGAEPLLTRVEGPPELRRRLLQTGVVAPDLGARLQPALKPGQRLVSKRGDLWRWDGFTAAADAPTPAAMRLAQRNRLAELEGRDQAAVAALDAARRAETAARDALAAAEAAERHQRQVWRDTQARLTRERDAAATLERAARDTEQRLAGLTAARAATEEGLAEMRDRLLDAEQALAEVDAERPADDEVAAADAAAEAARRALLDLRTEAAGLERERNRRRERRAALTADHARWTSRLANAEEHAVTLRQRAAETTVELAELEELPDTVAAQRERLADAVAEAEQNRRRHADRLAEAETALKAATTAVRDAHAAVSGAREAKARVEAHLDSARSRRAETARHIGEALDATPDTCLTVAGIEEQTALPTLADNERHLARLKADRERLGGVNLQAEDELATMLGQFEQMEKERTDVEEAIAKLRGGIAQLNREARKRLQEAFDTVNAHFQSLFTTLFGGGEARLEMIEGEDPMESGLEIIAKPPGKKPATLSLLSGGEQTLTALSLIFAVFLTNPSPICVLDEVDAPLDDANVDRFSTMMERMAAETETRFLVITHHPMTMARMDRLFGVTMGEKGVSQLVSVDLKTAERIIDQPVAASA